MQVFALSHPGMTGKNNEDRYSVSAYRLGEVNDVPALFAIIADGIGGHRAGEVAAELAVELISTEIANSDTDNPVESLRRAVISASRAIYHKSEEDPAYRGMGSTCACAWVIGTRLYITSVGDSRIYLIRNHRVHQLTVDHTWVQEAIEQGALRPEQARNHPNAHIIRRFLGSKTETEPDMRLRLAPDEDDHLAEANQGMEIQVGDALLLCSDGLTDLVDDEEILSTFQSTRGEDALRELIRLANERGGHDNITLVAMTATPPEPATIPVTARKERRKLTFSLLGMLSVAVFLIVVAALVYVYLERYSRNVTGDATAAPVMQVTLFPDATQVGTLESQPATPGVQATATAIESVIRATLTPWPTNTSSP